MEKIYRDRSVFESDGCEKVRAYDLGRIHSGRGKFLQNRPEFLCSPGGVKSREVRLTKMSHRTAEMSPDSMVAFPLNCYTDFSTWEGYMKSIRSLEKGVIEI